MTTFTQENSLIWRETISKKHVNHAFVRVSCGRHVRVNYSSQKERLPRSDDEYSTLQSTNSPCSALSDHIISPIVTSTSLDMPQIARKTKPGSILGGMSQYTPIPISDLKPSWHVFGNKRESNTQTTRLSHCGPQLIHPSIFLSDFKRNIHFWSQYAHISPFDWTKTAPEKEK